MKSAALLIAATILAATDTEATPLNHLSRGDVSSRTTSTTAMKQVSRGTILRRARDRTALDLVRRDAVHRSRNGRALAPVSSPAACTAPPVCSTDYQPTGTTSYALFQHWDLRGDDSATGVPVQPDLEACVEAAQGQGSSIAGAYYIPRQIQTGSGQCYPKLTTLSSGTWTELYDPAPASTILFGQCCDYQNMVPADVYSSCCQTRTTTTVYPTCAANVAPPGAGFAVFPLWDPIGGDFSSTYYDFANEQDCENQSESDNGSDGYYWIGQGVDGSGHNCYPKLAPTGDYNWAKGVDPDSEAVFRGQCADFEGIFPSDVMADCCNV